ncbi:MAG: hypothetical protein H0W61_12015 [Bacteroidetes bacterium]|nr:hypothetical protein [Bacteroidota bacterium]
MKKVFTITFTSLMLFIFSSVKAQTTDLLKSFINKNDFALRSVQKNTIRAYSASNAAAVKSILKLQLIAVKNYSTNTGLSKQAAYQARQESIRFLKNNSDVPSETFSIKEKETALFGTPKPIDSPDNYLSGAELKSVSETDIQNPASLNSFVTSIVN